MNDFANLARPTGIQWNGPHSGLVQYGDDSRLVVFFYQRPVLNDAKSRELGKPFYEEMTYIKIEEPGERLNKVDRPVTDNDKYRFAVQWNRFLQKLEQKPEGVPIDLLFPNNPAIPENLRGYGIYTIEQLAGLSANAIDSVGMGCQDWVNLAKDYLKNATDGAVFHKMRLRLEEKDQEIKVLNQRFNTLQAQFNALIAQFEGRSLVGQQPITNPSWAPGHDAAQERIDANHPSQEAVEQVQRKSKKDAKN